MGSMAAMAQDENEDMPKARPFALDTTIAAAKAMNNAMARDLGFALSITDTTNPRTVTSVYQTTGPEGLRIEFKYRNAEDDQGQPLPDKVVMYERILATEATITQVFNYIFGTRLQPNQLLAVASAGSRTKYKNGYCTYIFDKSEFRPGYWELTFVK